MITQFSFEEQYDPQPTRIYVNDEWLADALPQISTTLRPFSVPAVGYPWQVQDELEKRQGSLGTKGNISISGKNFLVWPEEYFKGPRTVNETLPNWFMMLKNASDTVSGVVPEVMPIENDTERLEAMGWTIPAGDGTLLEGAVDVVARSFFHIPEKPTDEDILKARVQRIVWLERLYARYEYYRHRSSYRTGVVNMVFNPYIVPGFPTVIFDSVHSGLHVTGYVTHVSHQMSPRGCSTSISYTHAQTLDEYLHEIRDAWTGNNPESYTYPVSAAPPNPIPELRAIMQVQERAEEYFTRLLHQNQTYSNNVVKSAAFNIFHAIDLVLESGEKVAPTPEKPTGIDYLSTYTDMAPAEAYKPMFESLAHALYFVSRPVCTLDEYISFREKGVRKGKIPFDHHRYGKGGVYWEKILDLIQGPGEAPEINLDTGAVLDRVEADTAFDWESRLVRYRTKILHQLSPIEG